MEELSTVDCRGGQEDKGLSIMTMDGWMGSNYTFIIVGVIFI